jgi:hypothetical protein
MDLLFGEPYSRDSVARLPKASKAEMDHGAMGIGGCLPSLDRSSPLATPEPTTGPGLV